MKERLWPDDFHIFFDKTVFLVNNLCIYFR